MTTHRKAHGIVDVTRAELRYGSREWQPGSHLTQRHHHGENGKTGHGITKKHGQRTSLGEGAADTEEETCANGATERDKLDVSRFQAGAESAAKY